MKRPPFPLSAIAVSMALMPTVALAHTGAGGTVGFSHGFMHPLTGIDHVLAVEPEQHAGRFTGGVVGTHTYQDGKVRKVEEWLAARGRSLADTVTTFYSDSINDLPLLERVTHPVVTNGDARLQAIARERGWPTLQLFEDAHA